MLIALKNNNNSTMLVFKNEFDSLILVVSCVVYLGISLVFDKCKNNVCKIKEFSN